MTKPDHTRSESEGKVDEAALSDRLSALQEKLDAEQARQAPPPQSTDKKGIAMAMRLSSEFIAGVVVGAGLGFGIDHFMGTSPWGMIIFLLLGFVAAVLNVLRSAGLVAQSELNLKAAREMSETTKISDQKKGDD